MSKEHTIDAVRAIQRKDAADINFLEQVLEVKRRSQEEINILCNLDLELEDPAEIVDTSIVPQPEPEPTPAPVLLDGTGGRSRNLVWNILQERGMPLTTMEIHLLLPEEHRKSESNTYNLLYNGVKSGHFKRVLTNHGKVKKFDIRHSGDPLITHEETRPLNPKDLEAFMRDKIKAEYLNNKHRELKPRDFLAEVNKSFPDATHNHLNALLASLQMSEDTTVIQLSKGQKKTYLIKTKDL